MNREEAKKILLLYRPESLDAEDPQIAAALDLAKTDAELGRWLAEHCQRQRILREKFRQVAAPAGLLEQIISEQAAQQRMNSRRKNRFQAAAAILVTCLALLFIAWNYWPFFQGPDVSLAGYQNRMAAIALSGYGMDLRTADPLQIRAYLAQHGAPANYVLPAPLENTAVTGCAIEDWNGQKVSLICFHTAQSLQPTGQSDLWLFVADRQTVKNTPAGNSPQFGPAGQLFTAAWVQDNKLYLLGTRGDETAIRKFL